MKLNELAATSPTKQAAKVFESYFGGSIKFERLTGRQAQSMLTRVRGLIAEHRRTPAFHHSEQNPTYLKLVVMERALTAKVMEVGEPVAATAAAANPAGPEPTIATRFPVRASGGLG